MNINDAFPSKWLKAGDAEQDDLILTIRYVEMEIVGQGEDAETKPVVYFDEVEKGLVLNRTNSDSIARLHGPDTDNWVGKRIALFATEVDFRGKSTLALRVRLRTPAAPKQEHVPPVPQSRQPQRGPAPAGRRAPVAAAGVPKRPAEEEADPDDDVPF